MFEHNIKWKIMRVISVALFVAIFSSFGSVTPALAGDKGRCSFFNESMSDANKAYQATSVDNALNLSKEFLKETASWKDLHGNRDACYMVYMLAFSTISGIMSDIYGAIISVITTKILDYVCDALTTKFDNILDEAVCIPMDDFSFNIDLPSLSRGGCSGIGGSDLLNVKPAPVTEFIEIPEELKHLPISRWLRDKEKEINGRF